MEAISKQPPLQSTGYDYLFKVLLTGMTCVGKTSASQRIIEGKFQTDDISTIFLDFRLKEVKYDDKVIKLQLWDTCGQERFRTLIDLNYRRCHGVLLMYDVTSLYSFEAIDSYVAEIQRSSPSNCQTILLGNKIDSERPREVTFQQGAKLANRLGMPFFEISVKTGYGVDEVLNELFSRMIKASKEQAEKNDSNDLQGTEERKNSRDSQYIQKLKQDHQTEKKSGSCL